MSSGYDTACCVCQEEGGCSEIDRAGCLIFVVIVCDTTCCVFVDVGCWNVIDKAGGC